MPAAASRTCCRRWGFRAMWVDGLYGKERVAADDPEEAR